VIETYEPPLPDWDLALGHQRVLLAIGLVAGAAALSVGMVYLARRLTR
jgi:hypothetical protein